MMDHSCHNGHVDNSVDAAYIVAAPSLPSGMAGFFNGLAYLVVSINPMKCFVVFYLVLWRC